MIMSAEYEYILWNNVHVLRSWFVSTYNIPYDVNIDRAIINRLSNNYYGEINLNQAVNAKLNEILNIKATTSIDIKVEKSEFVVNLIYKTCSHRLSNHMYEKLKIFNKSDELIFCIVSRYRLFEDIDEKILYPEEVNDMLMINFDVSFECFTSPLETYFSNYYSKFDIDKYFNSKGSFFDNILTGGSYLCNPPITMQNKVIKYIEETLKKTQVATSFIVFSLTRCLPINKQYVRQVCTIIKKTNKVNFWYKIEGQVYYNNYPEMYVIFIQNDEGFKRWKPTFNKMTKLRDVFDIDLDFVPQNYVYPIYITVNNKEVMIRNKTQAKKILKRVFKPEMML